MLREKFMKEIGTYGLASGPGPDAPVTEADIAGLPEAVKRYLRFMGAVGQPRIWSFRVALKGRFRMRSNLPWMATQTWQYNNSLDMSRIFYITLRFFSLIPVMGRDTYREGKGRMLIKVLDRFTLNDETGTEMNTSELTTYLNDAIMMAPSMLLDSRTTWSVVDNDSFEVSLTNQGLTVSARVFLDEQGAPRDFSTEDRFNSQYKPAARQRWSTPMQGWYKLNGRRIPERGQAVWHTPEGPLPYGDFSFIPGSLVYNLPPNG